MKRLIFALFGLVVLAAPAAAQTATVMEYYHLDAVGSVRAVTDQTGTVIRRHDDDPFGQELPTTPTGTDTPRFTGKERDAETLQHYFGARYYNSVVGRFMSVDPIIDVGEAMLDPQKWNRYSYAKNNPIRYNDPDGRETRMALSALQLAALDRARALRASISSWLGGGVIAGIADAMIAPLAPATPKELADNLIAGALPSAMAIESSKATVYVSRKVGDSVQYVGITNNIARRAADAGSKGIQITALAGLENLSRADARAVEQALIEINRLSKDGGTLLNLINSIAKDNPTYASALERGYELLTAAGYKVK